ncbi:methyl-accepting chemotaxis protein [Calditerrivibrio nitroreducens]|uniref:Methyl-accepting chemotaxis sensory transducer n=1 Tax=Calditerrivibrio nitroreducens (strain DSM 19672 / NBRC 101217 / Yu37-1) TaxID=768670 RepID=E4TGU1_CALNY|nr:methyl-accepting chemotaxis protein [Calditerrivibrio nitroreducens]ADR18701.1 methyl-accepting chemotaxis sensory transducer [Calditerrivibrio nitroreducens DSM 19672]
MNKQSLKKKLISSIIVMTLIITAVQIFSVYQIVKVKNDIGLLLNDHYEKVSLSNKILNKVNSIGIHLRDAVLGFSMGESKEHIRQIETLRNEIADILKNLEQSVTSNQGKEFLDDIKKKRELYANAQKRIIEYLNGGNVEVASVEMATLLPSVYYEYLKSVEAFAAFQEKEMVSKSNDAEKSLTILSYVIYISTAAYILLFIIIGFTMIRAVFKPLGGEPEFVKEILKKVAEGDLSMKVENPSPESVLGYTSKMVKELSQVIGNVRSSADTISAASEELHSTSIENKNSISEQNDRANQIATAAEEMTQTVSGIAMNATEMATAADHTTELALKGKDIVQKTTNEVQAIADTVLETSKVVATLGDKSQQIGEIANVIRDIADQTNLLALNAAIEAARAGEHGRGFAVVADEVRKLAERTQSATSEIEQMIRGIQKEVQIAVEKMDSGVHRVDEGVELSKEAINALDEIVAEISNLQNKIMQVASSVEQMSKVSDQVAVDINTLATSLNNSNLSADEVLNAADNLGRLANELLSLIKKFRV